MSACCVYAYAHMYVHADVDVYTHACVRSARADTNRYVNSGNSEPINQAPYSWPSVDPQLTLSWHYSWHSVDSWFFTQKHERGSMPSLLIIIYKSYFCMQFAQMRENCRVNWGSTVVSIESQLRVNWGSTVLTVHGCFHSACVYHDHGTCKQFCHSMCSQ